MTPRGRPPIDPEQRRTAAVPVRFTAEERALVEAAASREGEALSAWIRRRSVAAAKRSSRSAKDDA